LKSTSDPNLPFCCSNVREIPDNQEVFADPERDESVIIELLERASQTDLVEAAKFHWGELVQANESTPPQIIVAKPLNFGSGDSALPHFNTQHCSGAYLIVGRVEVAKFKEQARNVIHIFMCCIRLHNVTTDIIISMNVPLHINPESSSAKAVNNADLPNPDQELTVMSQIVASLNVTDWGLFQ
jgi:hypothetical protein